MRWASERRKKCSRLFSDSFDWNVKNGPFFWRESSSLIIINIFNSNKRFDWFRVWDSGYFTLLGVDLNFLIFKLINAWPNDGVMECDQGLRRVKKKQSSIKTDSTAYWDVLRTLFDHPLKHNLLSFDITNRASPNTLSKTRFWNINSNYSFAKHLIETHAMQDFFACYSTNWNCNNKVLLQTWRRKEKK